MLLHMGGLEMYNPAITIIESLSNDAILLTVVMPA